MKVQGERKELVIISIFSILFLGIVLSLQLKDDELRPAFEFKYKVVDRDLLPAKILPYIHFGFANVFADYYWIASIQDFVGWNGKDSFALEYLRNITTLDPQFEYPYLFSILVIPQNNTEEKKEKSLVALASIAKISEHGMQALPTSWKIPFYLGSQYYTFTKTYTEAKKYLKIAAEKKDAPPAVYITYSAIVANSIRGYKASHELSSVIYNNTDNEIIKKIASKGIEEANLSQMLEQGIRAYKEKYKRYPKTAKELQDVKFISLPDGFYDVFAIDINQKNGDFSVVER